MLIDPTKIIYKEAIWKTMKDVLLLKILEKYAQVLELVIKI